MGTGHSIYHGAELFCIKIDDNIVVEILGKPPVLFTASCHITIALWTQTYNL